MQAGVLRRQRDGGIVVGQRADLTPAGYAAFAAAWRARGASVIGGCCGIGPEHIAALRRIA